LRLKGRTQASGLFFAVGYKPATFGPAFFMRVSKNRRDSGRRSSNGSNLAPATMGVCEENPRGALLIASRVEALRLSPQFETTYLLPFSS